MQGQMPKTKCLNPERRLALSLGRELNLWIQLGAPLSWEEAGVAGRSEKRAWKAPLNPPKDTD